MQQQEPSGGLLSDSRSGMNAAVAVAQIIATVPAIVLHRGVGPRYIGIHALLGVIVMFFWPVLHPTSNPMPLIYLLFAVLGCCLIHRITNLLRARDPHWVGHGYYTGYPWLCVLLRHRVREVPVKIILEPCLLLGIGFHVHDTNAPVGSWLMTSAVALFLSVSTSVMRDRNRLADLHDSLLEQQHLAERLKAYRIHRR